MIESSTHSAMDLWHAPDAVGVLHPGISFAMGFADLASFQKPQEMGGSSLLPRMRSRLLEARIERGGSILEAFKGHRSGDVGYANEALGAVQSKTAHGVHALSSVKQRQTFLGGEFHRF